MAILQSRLAERARQEQQAHLEEIRGDQGEAAWGRQIRSYVMQPYQMVKDLRTDMRWGMSRESSTAISMGFVEAISAGDGPQHEAWHLIPA